ncbi:MAG: hypothetical protein WBA51_03880 [Erythrobacter sp.]
MNIVTRLTLALCAIAAATATPAHADTYVTDGVSFFERVSVGSLEVTPVNIFYDDRCTDPRLCFGRNSMIISVVMHTPQGLREVVLRLGQPARVPGGLLLLTKAGTPPSRNGAINLEKYQLELVFIPVPKDYRG